MRPILGLEVGWGSFGHVRLESVDSDFDITVFPAEGAGGGAPFWDRKFFLFKIENQNMASHLRDFPLGSPTFLEGIVAPTSIFEPKSKSLGDQGHPKRQLD